jgi:hypothetical protein
MGAVGYASIRPDGSKTMARIAFDTFEEVHPGAIEVAPRLAYMDEHGLTMQIVYPNILGFAGNLVMNIGTSSTARSVVGLAACGDIRPKQGVCCRRRCCRSGTSQPR